MTGFDVGRYLGRWYEIARLDHPFERGLINVTAEYSRKPDGGISVINRGFDPPSGRWKEAKGSAEFVGPEDVASLRVTFFWPFWGGYHVFELDRQEYRYALVTSDSRSYLWFLSRSPKMDQRELDRLVRRASDLGFETGKLIFVEQNASAPDGRSG